MKAPSRRAWDRAIRARLLVAGLLLSTGGCYDSLDLSKVACRVDHDRNCPAGYQCRAPAGSLVGQCCKPDDTTCGIADAAEVDVGIAVDSSITPFTGPYDGGGSVEVGGEHSINGSDLGEGESLADASSADGRDAVLDVSLGGTGGAGGTGGSTAATGGSSGGGGSPATGGAQGLDGAAGAGGSTAVTGGVPGTGGRGQGGVDGKGTGGTTAGTSGIMGTGGTGTGGVSPGTGGSGSGGSGTGGSGTGGNGTGGASPGTGGSGSGGSGTGGSGTGGASLGTGGSGTGGNDTGGAIGTGGGGSGGCQTGQAKPEEVVFMGESFYAIDPQYIEKRVAADAQAAGALAAGTSYRNEAQSGQTLNYIATIEWRNATQGVVKVVIMDGGGIDCLGSGACPTCASQFTTLLDKMATAGVQDVIYTRYPEPGYPPGSNTTEKACLDTVMPAMQAVCEAATGLRCHWVDLRPVWVDGDVLNDGLHPTPSGGDHVGDAIWAEMVKDCIAQ